MSENKINKKRISFDVIEKRIGLIGGSLGIIISIIAIISVIKPSKHQLEILVPTTSINDSNIQISMIFNNTGDFNEIITDISCYFVQNYEDEKLENNILICEYDKMLLIYSNSSWQNIFNSEIDLNKSPLDIMLQRDIKYTIVMTYRIALEDGTFVLERLPNWTNPIIF